MELIYIKYLGQDYLNNNLYQFLFATSSEDVTDESWTITPANGNVEIPINNVSLAKKLTTKFTFDLVQDSNTFSYFDAVEDVISIAWENIDNYDETKLPDNRLHFKFGTSIGDVNDKLSDRGLSFD